MKRRISDLSVEELINKYYQTDGSDVEIPEREMQHLSESESKQFQKKLAIAKKRIVEPLELPLKLQFILLPYSSSPMLGPADTSEIDRIQKFGFKRKEKQYVVYTIIGYLFHASIGIIISIIWALST